MGLRSTRAIVSYTMRMTNSSKLVSLITEQYGLVKVMAKGARRPQSKFGASLEPVTLIECIYFHRDTREIQNISNTEILEPYTDLKTDITLLAVASCMVEIAGILTAPDDPTTKDIFALVVESLKELDGSRTQDAEKHLWRFILRLLARAGYRPLLEQCISCGKKLKGSSVFLSLTDGGVLCSCTDPGERYGLRISHGSLMVMQALGGSDRETLTRLKMGVTQRAEIERALLSFLSYHTGSTRTLRSLEFLKKIHHPEVIIHKSAH